MAFRIREDIKYQPMTHRQKRTESLLAVQPIHLAHTSVQSDLQYRCTFSLVCLLPGNKTTGAPLIK